MNGVSEVNNTDSLREGPAEGGLWFPRRGHHLGRTSGAHGLSVTQLDQPGVSCVCVWAVCAHVWAVCAPSWAHALLCVHM